MKRMMKTNLKIYAFGDIHGEFLKLKSLMEKVLPQKDDKLIFLGDYIDRGKKSFEVIDYLVSLSKEYDCVFLRGNHEDYFLNYMRGVDENYYIGIGGANKTFKSYRKYGYNLKVHNHLRRRFPKEQATFLQKLKYYYETEDYIFVHAGVDPEKGVENTDKDDMLWDISFSSKPYEGKIVVYGHHAEKNVLNERYKICIDTGACYADMGNLTCVQLPDRIFIQQD